MFPVPGDEIYHNADGEVTGWGKPEEPVYHDLCGYTHPEGACPEEDRWSDDDNWEMDDARREHDPGPEVDDEGGMSEYRGAVDRDFEDRYAKYWPDAAYQDFDTSTGRSSIDDWS